MKRVGARWVKRHDLAARLWHAANAVALLGIVGAGLVLSGVMPGRWLGGHGVAILVHEDGGIIYIGLVAFAMAMAWARRRQMMNDALRDIFCPGETKPMGALRRALLSAGRFTLFQRYGFAFMLVAVGLAGASGVYLYYLPPLGARAVALAMRLHVTAAWLFVVWLALHILAGVGVLRSHRGIWRGMWLDGRVSHDLAARLWPRWLDRR